MHNSNGNFRTGKRKQQGTWAGIHTLAVTLFGAVSCPVLGFRSSEVTSFRKRVSESLVHRFGRGVDLNGMPLGGFGNPSLA